MSIRPVSTPPSSQPSGTDSVAIAKEKITHQKARLAQAKVTLLGDGEFLEGSDREEFESEIEKIYLQSEAALDYLSRQNLSQSEFIRQSEENLESFNSFGRGFLVDKIINQRPFQETTEKISSIDKMISTIAASSPPALPQERVLDELKKNPFYLVNRENIAMNMAVAQLGALASDAVVAGLKAACKSTSVTEKVCRSTLEFGKAAVSTAGDIGKAALDSVGLKEPVKRVVTALKEHGGESLKTHWETTYGIPRETTQRHIENTYKLAPWLIPVPAVPVISFFWKKVKGAERGAEVVEKAISPISRGPRDVVLSREDVTILSPPSPAYFQNRIITEPTKLVPEDIGMNSVLFEKRSYILKGWMTRETNEIFKIEVDHIRLTEGHLSNFLIVMDHFKEIAKANQAKTLQVEAYFINKKLEAVMVKRYGKPSIFDGTQVFKIPVDN